MKAEPQGGTDWLDLEGRALGRTELLGREDIEAGGGQLQGSFRAGPERWKQTCGWEVVAVVPHPDFSPLAAGSQTSPTVLRHDHVTLAGGHSRGGDGERVAVAQAPEAGGWPPGRPLGARACPHAQQPLGTKLDKDQQLIGKRWQQLDGKLPKMVEKRPGRSVCAWERGC